MKFSNALGIVQLKIDSGLFFNDPFACAPQGGEKIGVVLV